MRRYIKNIVVIAVLLMGTTTRAEDLSRFSFVYLLNGNASTETDAGYIRGSISQDGKTATITITPAEGNYITAENITVVKTISGYHAQARTVLADVLDITPTSNDADPSGETEYTFEVTDDNYNYEITADFHSRTSVEPAIITTENTSFIYNGEAIEPIVTVKLGNNTLGLNTDYSVAYRNNVEAGEAIITITGLRTYTGTKNYTFIITKATPTLTFSKETASLTIGEEITGLPTLSNPEELAVTYSSSDTNIATVSEDGKVTLVAPGETTISAEFEGSNNYEAATASYTLYIAPGTITGITATGYTGTYDGIGHGITVAAPEGTTIKYGTKKGTYNLDESPTYTDAGTYWAHYQIERTNYNTIADSAKVEISKATTAITFDEQSYSATFGETFTAPVANTDPEGLNVTATSSSNTLVATVADGVISIIGIGETTITVSFAGNNNYKPATATYNLNVAAGTITGITATGYTGTYDGIGHGITVTAPEEATIKYGTKKGTYNLNESPTYTDAGSYMVHYQVERTNYNTITDSLKVEISKANINPTVTLEGWTYGATANTPEVIGNIGNGEETFTYKPEGEETFTSEVPKAVGTHTLKVTIAETTNYYGGEAITTFTITKRTFDSEKDITFAEGQTFASFYSTDEELELPESGITAYMITGIEGNTLITQAISYIPKDTPVLIEKTGTSVELKNPSEVENNMLQYAAEDVTADGTLYILYNGEYVKATGIIPQGKCYLKTSTPSGSRRLIIGHSNGTNSISKLEADTKIEKWFDLKGQTISKPKKKGLYIKNGKKVIVK